MLRLVSILMILNDQKGIICDPALNIDDFSGGQTGGDHIHQSDHDFLEFA